MGKLSKLFILGSIGSLNAAALSEVGPRADDKCPSQELAKMCEQTCTKELSGCLGLCKEQVCVNECTRDGAVCMEDCPCHENCPLGCENCDSWVCVPSPSTSDKIFIVHNNEGNVPMLFDDSGAVSEVNQFKFEQGTGSFRSCSAVINGRMLIFGGLIGYTYDVKQISEVKSCSITRIGDLPMDFYYGACNTFTSSGTEEVLLCFDYYAENTCHSFDGHGVVEAQSTTHPHTMTSLGNYNESPLAVGSFDPDNIKVEIRQAGSWSSLSDFPYVDNSISQYSMVTLNGGLYLFGGYGDGRTLDLAVRYDGRWSEVGSLLAARSEHRSIVVDNSIMHIGGEGNKHFEQWTVQESGFNRKELLSSLYYYNMYPESFVVDWEFCQTVQ